VQQFLVVPLGGLVPPIEPYLDELIGALFELAAYGLFVGTVLHWQADDALELEIYFEVVEFVLFVLLEADEGDFIGFYLAIDIFALINIEICHFEFGTAFDEVFEILQVEVCRRELHAFRFRSDVFAVSSCLSLSFGLNFGDHICQLL
jgi:hypothetical protein